ncbi:MAG TPA: RDD family protein [Bacilli bacterium]|nr:RDD family protein [Bacilli bacterium]
MEENANLKVKESPREARTAPLPRPGRRIGAAVIDLFLFVIALFAVDLGVMNPIMDGAVAISERRTTFTNDQKDSRLYVVTYVDGNGSEISEPTSDDIENGTFKITSLDAAKYSQAVYEYYTVYKVARINDLNNEDPERAGANQAIKDAMGEDFANDPTEWYIANILQADVEDSLFTLTAPASPSGLESSENPSDTSAVTSESQTTSEGSSSEEVGKDVFLPEGVYFKADTTDSDLTTFFTSHYSNAVSDFNAEPDHAQTISYNNMILIVSMVVSSMIVYLLFPLVFAGGATLGKKLLNLGVVNTYGYKARWWQIVARYLATFIFEILLGYMTSFITTFISFTMLMFGKKARAAHDFIAGTRPVDTKEAKIYRDAMEEDELDPLPLFEKPSAQEQTEKNASNSFYDRLSEDEKVVDAEYEDKESSHLEDDGDDSKKSK